MKFASKLAKFFRDNRSTTDTAESKHATDNKDATDSKHATDNKDATAVTESKYGPVEHPTAKPWSAVCHLKTHFGDDDTSDGTGFLISETMVITAAHNLCRFSKGKIIEPIMMSIRPASQTDPEPDPPIPSSNYKIRSDPKYADCLRAQAKAEPKSPEWLHYQEIKSYYDYGAILLDAGIRKPGFLFQVRGTEPNHQDWDKSLACTGYTENIKLNKIMLYSSQGGAYRDGRFIGDESNLVRHSARVERGQSGGPLYVLDGELVVGIQVRVNPRAGSNINTFGAVRITKGMEKLFRDWDDENRRSFGIGKDQRDISA
jgi:V8-like Glu-specific endopeptidase